MSVMNFNWVITNSTILILVVVCRKLAARRKDAVQKAKGSIVLDLGLEPAIV